MHNIFRSHIEHHRGLMLKYMARLFNKKNVQELKWVEFSFLDNETEIVHRNHTIVK